NKKLINVMKVLSIIVIIVLTANFFLTDSKSNAYVDEIYSDTLRTIEPKNHFTLENQLVTTMLSRYHFKDFSLDDSLSSLMFDKYLKTLDYSRVYFYESDISSLEKERYSFDDYLLAGNVEPFFDVFNLYEQRMLERMEYVDTILAKGFDFTLNDSAEVIRDNSDWAASREEMNKLWEGRIKNDALNLYLAGRDEEAIKSNLKKRYINFSRALYQYNSEDVFQLAMDSYTSSIDPHTNYLSPATSENFRIDMSLSLEGIGARLMSEDGYTKVVEVIPGGPAFRSKLIDVDDRIIAVAQEEDGEFVDVIGWRITDVVKLIRGPKETTVRLQLLKARDGVTAKPEEITLVRDKVKLEDQAAQKKIVDVNNNGLAYRIGVITIPKFYTDFEGTRNGDNNPKSTVTDVRKLLEELNQEKVDGVVIDLRNNGGGALSEAIDVTGLFIDKGPIVQVKNTDGFVEVGEDIDPSLVYSGPLAVLVNRFSASASEIFAAAIQDYERGIVVGEQTYGKGTVQNLIDLNRVSRNSSNKFGQLKLTIAKYYRINGGSTQNLGVVPDITFPTYIDAQEFGESSETSALPWDQIDPTDFKLYSDLDKILPELISSSEKRRNSDPEFSYLIEDINAYKVTRNQRYISLNEEIRKQKKEADDEKEFQRENERRQRKGLKLLEKNEVPEKNEDADDIFITETAMIVTDMINLSGGLTKLH
ncbi:MAG: carboxy terminal-processing peptidase, partial [Ignavibacteriaceae bacterium]|nr:carboxy terminal-processing peptidase [Ignavibacteriaceae bacterium]